MAVLKTQKKSFAGPSAEHGPFSVLATWLAHPKAAGMHFKPLRPLRGGKKVPHGSFETVETQLCRTICGAWAVQGISWQRTFNV